MKSGATLGLSHGFLLGVMQNDGVDFRPDINVVLMAPKVRPCRLKKKKKKKRMPALVPSTSRGPPLHHAGQTLDHESIMPALFGPS